MIRVILARKKAVLYGTIAVLAALVAGIAFLAGRPGIIAGTEARAMITGSGSYHPALAVSRETVENLRPYIGITYHLLTPAMAARYGIPGQSGALVTAVAKDSPAERAGVRLNDVILAFDTTAVGGMCNMVEALLRHKPGDRVQLLIMRQQQVFTIEIELGRR